MNKHTKIITAALMSTVLSTSAFAASGGDVVTDDGALKGIHFDKKGKKPSAFTSEIVEKLRAEMNFSR